MVWFEYELDALCSLWRDHGKVSNGTGKIELFHESQDGRVESECLVLIVNFDNYVANLHCVLLECVSHGVDLTVSCAATAPTQPMAMIPTTKNKILVALWIIMPANINKGVMTPVANE